MAEINDDDGVIRAQGTTTDGRPAELTITPVPGGTFELQLGADAPLIQLTREELAEFLARARDVARKAVAPPLPPPNPLLATEPPGGG